MVVGIKGEEKDMNEYDPLRDSQLDENIKRHVQILRGAGIETFESCEGGDGHIFPQPTIRFHGDRSEGLRALAAALQNGLSVCSIQRIWPVIDGEPTGPWWQIVFND